MSDRFEALADRLAERVTGDVCAELAPLLTNREPEPLLDPAGLARYIGVKRSTIYAWVREGRITPIQLDPDGNRPRLRFDHQEVLEQLKATEAGPNPPRQETVPSTKKAQLLPVQGETTD
jgi:excisionase family DNA binding protein